ncbi:MAG TPA: hypothetical protein VFT55_14375 [Planctomycetota bacterium]|nr:hypothetical protein [Planctomycetota bacterium]
MDNHFADIVLQRDISISQIKTWTYDQGVGQPPVPTQVGNQGVVNVYTCPNTRLGNETTAPTAPGSPWTLVGSGTLTVVATPAESPVVFNPPITIMAGTYGLAIEYLAPTSGQNPGQLHCLGKSPATIGVVSDQFITWSNDGIQGVGWSGGVTASPNLRITYTPEATSAHWVKAGEGCYFRPFAWYENFPPSATPPDVQNTAMDWIFTGSNYIVAPSAATYVTPTGTSLTATPPPFSSSANWDDALSPVMTLPFTLNYPGGSTTEITISSNGGVYLANVGNNTYETCGACYGAISSWRDQPARIAGYFHDLDPSDPVSGGIYYEVDPGNAWVRVTFANVVEWQIPSVPTALNRIQITIFATGSITTVYGQLANVAVANGNNAILGFTPGNGSTLPPPIDISASLSFATGDGRIPPVLKLDGRPVLGSTFNIVTSNIDPATIFQLLSLGDTLTPFPISLSFIGMTDCFLHHNALLLLTQVGPPAPDFVAPLSIPNNPVFFNAQLTAQAFPFALGENPFGLISSNGVCMRIGN